MNHKSAADVIKTAVVSSNWKSKGSIMEKLPDSVSRVWSRWTDSGQQRTGGNKTPQCQSLQEMYPGPWGTLSWNDYHSTLDKSNTVSYRLTYDIINASLWIQTLLSEKVKLYSFGFHFLKAPILSGTKQVIGKLVANRIEVYDPQEVYYS